MASEFRENVAVERAATTTQLLPVVVTVAAPVEPAETAALPPVPRPPARCPRPRARAPARDRTPLVIGLTLPS